MAVTPNPPTSTPHGTLLKLKANDNKILSSAWVQYEKFVQKASALKIVDQASVEALVDAFNDYRDAVIYPFENGKNVPQETLRSGMLEEFFGWLFRDIFEVLKIDEPKNYYAGKSTGSYLSLSFAPKNFPSLFTNPNPKIAKKNQDFAIGSRMQLEIRPADIECDPVKESFTLPVVAIECKTYLAKNHLDMCSSTAQSLNRANPYCMYIIAAEFLKMDSGVTPEVTDISEIFLLCKAKNSERNSRKRDGISPHPVHKDVVWELYRMVIGHLSATWWDPENALERGKVISRPF